MKKYFSVILIAMFIVSCKSSNEIGAISYRGYEYENLTCYQLSKEISYLDNRTSEMAEVVDDKKKNAEITLAVGLIIWPVLFFVDDNSDEARIYAELKGKYESVRKTYLEKNC